MVTIGNPFGILAERRRKKIVAKSQGGFFVFVFMVCICVSFKMSGFPCLNVDRISNTTRLAEILKKRLLKMYSSENAEGDGVQSTGKGMILLSLD